MASQSPGYRSSILRGKKLLSASGTSSIKGAFRFLGAAIVAGSVVGGGMALNRAFDVQVLWSLCILVMAMLPVSFVVLEWMRLTEHSDALREIMNYEMSYDVLLQDTRKEREELRAKVQSLIAEREVFIAAQRIRIAMTPPMGGPPPEMRATNQGDEDAAESEG